MSYLETLKIALRSLAANKIRSALTMLGIIIGVASVVTMVAIGQGAQAQLAEQIRSLGANVLMVQAGAARQGGASQGSGTGHTLTESDAVAIGSLQVIEAAAPTIWGTIQVIAGNRNANTRIYGTTGDYFVVREWTLSAGRYFTSGEERDASKVVLIGNTIAEELFPNSDPIGQAVRILQVPFEIIGVLSEKGLTGTGRDQDDTVMVPLSTAKQRLIGSTHQVNREAVQYILVKASPDQTMEIAEAYMGALLRQRHRLMSHEANDFQITDPTSTANARHESARTTTLMLAAIASISLIVGGISIMNIMLVSVTERTREIGLRISLGARKRDIRNQFLIEALTLCALGGLLGLAIGTGISIGAAQIGGWPIFVSPSAMIAAVAFSGAVGIFFGYYPARRAAALNPIECLRTE